jgi:hypothetical protein
MSFKCSVTAGFCEFIHYWTAPENSTQSETTLRLCLFMEGQVANEALPTAEPSASAATALNIGRFRNWKMMAIELAVALLGFYVFTVTTTGNLATPGFVGVIAGIGSLWLFLRDLLGISIDSETLTMPTRQIPWMPALSFRRGTGLLSEVHRLTLSARWFGFEVVKISGDFGWTCWYLLRGISGGALSGSFRAFVPASLFIVFGRSRTKAFPFAHIHGSEMEPHLG